MVKNPLCSVVLTFGLIVKVAFVYADTRKRDFHAYVKPSVHPTYRVSTEVYPKLFGHTNVSFALSDINKAGTIKPLAVSKYKLNY